MEFPVRRTGEAGKRSMTETNQRRLLFLGLWLTLPWPMVVFGEAFVPAVRYVLLAAAAARQGKRAVLEILED